MAKQINILKEHDVIETNVKKFLEKLHWLKSFSAFIFEFLAILLLFLEILAHFKMLYLLEQLSFSQLKDLILEAALSFLL